jgi:hypothetical protein
MEMREGCWMDPNYFESDLPFGSEEIENLQKPSE